MENPRILISGADGFIGSQLVKELLRRGRSVRKAMRKAEELIREDTRRISSHGPHKEAHRLLSTAIVGDIGRETDWVSAMSGITAVVHLAARVHVMRDKALDPLAEFRSVNVLGTKNLAEAAAQAGVKRFVFLSSVKVNGEETAKGQGPFRETDAPQPEDAYGISKWEAEEALREIEKRRGIEVVIIRPPLVYGPGVKANFLNFIKLIESGVPLPFGSIHNQRSFLSLTNLVDLICCCLEHPGASGQTFLASDGDDVSTPELVLRIAAAIGKRAWLFPVPEWFMRIGAAGIGQRAAMERLWGSLRIDSTKARKVLGWLPPCKMEEELRLVAAWRGWA